MPVFKKGDCIQIHGGSEISIVSDEPLGSGGQGEVYKVRYCNKDYALKWYISANIKENAKEFRKNIEKNISKTAPSDRFLWPLHVTEIVNGSFGYLMELIPENYVSFSDILRTYSLKVDENGKAVRKRVGFTSLDTMFLSALHIVKAFRELQRCGMSYQDLNDGGFYIDTTTGDVLICDCDNVSGEGKNLGIKGKPGYMAPDIVTGESKPGPNSDKYSLAVVLFKLLMRGDPLEGKAVCSRVVLTGSAELEHYGSNPVFIFHPVDKSNVPIQGIHNNVIKNWNLYPQYIRDEFTKVFTKGLKDPSERPIPNEWFKIISKLRKDVILCECGHQSFLPMSNNKEPSFKCPSCNRHYSIINLETGSFVLYKGANLHPSDISSSSEDYVSIIAKVVENRNYPGILGIKNMSNDTWVVNYDNNVQKEIPPNGGTMISNPMHITFGRFTNNFNKIPEGKIGGTVI